MYHYSGIPRWETSPFKVSKSKIQGYGAFFDPGEKDLQEIPEDTIMFPYGGVIKLRNPPIGNFSF